MRTYGAILIIFENSVESLHLPTYKARASVDNDV